MNLPILVWIFLALIWGSTWLMIKIGLNDLPPFTFAGIRFVIAVIPLAFLVWLQKKPLPRDSQTWILMIGTGLLVFTFNYGLVFWGENHISSGLTAILYTLLPLFGLVMAHFRLAAEPMTWQKVSGVILGIAGVALIFSRQIEFVGSMAMWGSAAIIIAAMGTSYANIEIKARGQALDPLVLTTIQIFVGMLPLLGIGLLSEGNPLEFNWTPLAWFSIFYLALIGTSLPFVLLYWLIKHMEITKVQLMPLVSTLIAVLLGWVILGEELSWRTALGGVMILGGLAVATLLGRRRPALSSVEGQN